MSGTSQGFGWWLASDGRWYPPEQHPAVRATPRTGTQQFRPQPAPVARRSVPIPPGAIRVIPPGSPAPRKPGRARARVVVLLLVVALMALAVVIVDDVVIGSRPFPPEGTAVVVAGQRTNILPSPDFLTACSASQYDDSGPCVTTTLQAINHARAREGLAPMVLPTNWGQLTPAEQLFVATNLERTARGLTPVSGMSDGLNQVAARAAADGTDPQLKAGGSLTTVAGNWIQGYSSPLEALYIWVYDDGLGSTNSDCSRQALSGCWAHRANVLVPLPCSACALGAAFAPTDAAADPLSYAEVLVESLTPLTDSFSWAEEQPYLG